MEMEAGTDEAELRRLVESYAMAMDRGDAEGFHDLFTADGALVVLASDGTRELGTFRGPGPDGVGLVARLIGERYCHTMHHVTNHIVSIDGDTSTGTTYCLAYHLREDERIETLGVSYADSYVRTDAGWRIRMRRATRVWSQIEALDSRPLLVDRAAMDVRRG